MKTSDKLKAFTKQQEGLRLKSYVDSVGVITIGYGHTSCVRSGQTITEQEANTFFEDDIYECELDLNGFLKLHNISLLQGQYDACIDFIFNLGYSRFRGSTLAKLIAANPQDSGIPAQFKRWVYGDVNGKEIELSALVRRRAGEVNFWLS